MLAYHATDNLFDRFDSTRCGSYTDANTPEVNAARMARLGFWLSDHDIRPATCQAHLLTCEVTIERPYETTYDALWDMLTDQEAAELVAALKAEGYDGIVLADTEFGGQSCVAFDADQIAIKSID